MPGRRVLRQADSVYRADSECLRHHRQECPDRLGGITVPGAAFRDVVADLPGPVFQRNHLDIPDILPAGFGDHRIGQRTFCPAVPGHQETDHFPGLVHCLKNFIRNKPPVILIQRVLMDRLRHVRRKLRDHQPFRINPHLLPAFLFLSRALPYHPDLRGFHRRKVLFLPVRPVAAFLIKADCPPVFLQHPQAHPRVFLQLFQARFHQPAAEAGAIVFRQDIDRDDLSCLR